MDPYSLVQIMSEGINRGYLPLVSFFNSNFDYHCYFQHPSNVILSRGEESKDPYPRVVVAVVSLLNSSINVLRFDICFRKYGIRLTVCTSIT